MGRLIFYNYKKQENLPVMIHQTTALLSKSDIDVLNSNILHLFAGEFNAESGFKPFSAN